MLTGQRILITGANGGIGLSICETLLRNNAKLVLFYHKKRAGIDKLLKDIENLKPSVEIEQVNLLDDSKIEQTMSKILQTEPIDGFIHSVSPPLETKSFLGMQWKDFQFNIEIQTKSFLKIVQLLSPSMKKNHRGKIINILTSAVIGKPPSNMSNYIVGKYSLLGLSKALAVELGSFNINVNSISPAMTNTALIEKLPSKLKEIAASQVPLGRLAEPSDIASVALFLCSKHSNYISGENIVVSAGQTMH